MVTITHKKYPEGRYVHISGDSKNKVISAYLTATLGIFKRLLLDLTEVQGVENKREIFTEKEFLISFSTEDKNLLVCFDGISKGFTVLKEQLEDDITYIYKEVEN